MPSPPSKNGSNRAQTSNQTPGTVSDVEPIKPDTIQNQENPTGEPASDQRIEEIQEWVDAHDTPWNHVAALKGTSKTDAANEASADEKKHAK